jgi:hypothetical protein
MTHFHAVRFYDSSESVADIVAAFLGAGFITYEPALVIATPARRAAIASALSAISFSVESLERSGNFLTLDAQHTLDAFLLNGVPDPVRFETLASAAFGRLNQRDRGGIRVYDEMAHILWRRAETDAALRMEMLWDRATRDYNCSLLCGHAMADFRSAAAPQALCAPHSHVLAPDGVPHRNSLS